MEDATRSDSRAHLAVFRRLADVVDDEERLGAELCSLDKTELVSVVSYLVKLRKTRDACVRRSKAACKEKHGCSANWYYAKRKDVSHDSVEEAVPQ
jgi:hypothetical protein